MRASTCNEQDGVHLQAIARWIGLQFEEMVASQQEDYVWPDVWHSGGHLKRQVPQWEPPLWLWHLFETAAERVPALRLGQYRRLYAQCRNPCPQKGNSRVSNSRVARSCLSRAYKFHPSHDLVVYECVPALA
eukprot:2763766-Amphidinium_carterae.1